nr:hypothetical protein [Tanacetum cinerariifolium]
MMWRRWCGWGGGSVMGWSVGGDDRGGVIGGGSVDLWWCGVVLCFFCRDDGGGVAFVVATGGCGQKPTGAAPKKYWRGSVCLGYIKMKNVPNGMYIYKLKVINSMG